MRARAVVCVLLTAACGGGGAHSPSSSERQAKAAFLAQAEAVCAQATADLHKLKSPKTNAEIAAYVHAVIAVARTSTDRLSALSLPPADAAALRTHVLEPLQRQGSAGADFDRQVQAVAADQQKLLALLASAPTKTRADLPFMRSYGFRSCVTAADTGH